MLHRNLAEDDGRGLSEGNNDRTNANSVLRIMVGADAETLDSNRASLQLTHSLAGT